MASFFVKDRFFAIMSVAVSLIASLLLPDDRLVEALIISCCGDGIVGVD